MRKSHFTTNGRIPAAAYYRVSSDKQDRSIDEQQEEVRKYADENGYETVREYRDDAVSGWKACASWARKARLGSCELVHVEATE